MVYNTKYTKISTIRFNYCRTSVQELVCHIRGVDIITFSGVTCPLNPVRIGGHVTVLGFGGVLREGPPCG